MINQFIHSFIHALLLISSDKILVFCDSLYPLELFERIFHYPVLTGNSSDKERKRVLGEFRQNTGKNIVFLSKIGDTSIDLPEATVLIQVEGQEGSRRQEAQRLGRILRPKLGMEPGTQAFFYTLVSRDTKVGFGIQKGIKKWIEKGIKK